MKNEVEPDFLSQLDTVFAQLNPQAVEEFYAAYRQWSTQQRITELRQRIDAVREQQAHNQQRLQETRPAAIALAALARLQSNGVSDIALLDAMLERGESWLDQTMQRLDYFEQFDDFISDDYTKWCQGALEGAFDWIDSLREATGQAALETPPAEISSNNEDTGDVEALLLQRLATEKEQDDLSWQEAITLKQTVIKAPPSEIVTTEAEEQEPPAPEHLAQQDAEIQAQETEYVSPDEPVQYVMGEEQAERPAGDREGSLPIPPNPHLYYDDRSGSPGPFIVEAGADVEEGAGTLDPRGRLQTLKVLEREAEDTANSESEQPALIEFAPIEEPSPTESELYTGDEQPALVEFAAPSELSPAEETHDQVAEQAAEITVPEDIPTEETAQSEVDEPDEMGNSAPEVPHQKEAISSNRTARPARSVRRNGGFLRRLLRFLARV